MDPTDFFDVLSHLEARLVVKNAELVLKSQKIALLPDTKKPLPDPNKPADHDCDTAETKQGVFVILGFLYPQHCGTSGNEAGLVYLHGPLCTTGAVSLESSPHSHLPALYQGEKEI